MRHNLFSSTDLSNVTVREKIFRCQRQIDISSTRLKFKFKIIQNVKIEFVIEYICVSTWENVPSTCAPDEDSNQPAHQRSPIRVFVARLKKRFIIDYPKRAQWRFWSDCANAQSDLNLRWVRMFEGTFPNVANIITIMYLCIWFCQCSLYQPLHDVMACKIEYGSDRKNCQSGEFVLKKIN